MCYHGDGVCAAASRVLVSEACDTTQWSCAGLTPGAGQNHGRPSLVSVVSTHVHACGCDLNMWVWLV